jgi:hypothetical protein
MGMPVINEEHTGFIRTYLDWFARVIEQRLGTVLRNEVKYHLPPDVVDVENQINRLVEVAKTEWPGSHSNRSTRRSTSNF